MSTPPDVKAGQCDSLKPQQNILVEFAASFAGGLLLAAGTLQSYFRVILE
jgi:hypothetical protein